MGDRKKFSGTLSRLTKRSAITKMQAILIVVIIIVIAAVGVYYVALPPKKGPVELVFTSPEWLPGELTGEIAKGFGDWSEKNLGYRVTVKMDLNPWGTYHDRLATVFAAKGSDFDLLISDSQFVGEFAVGGHIIKVNDWIKAHHPKDVDMFQFYPNLVKYYCTYPVWDFSMEKFAAGDLQLDTVNYYGLPHEADTMLLVWRVDLFRNADERAAFKTKYGYDLPQTYDDWKNWVTWENWLDFAKFFTRKAGETLAGETLKEDFYGMATWNAVYDSGAYPFHGYLWSAAGEIWDEKTHKVDGYINSALAVEALQWHVDSYATQPPGSEKYWFDECNTAMAQAKVATMMNAAGFLAPLFDPTKSLVSDKIEVTMWPLSTRSGKPIRYTQLVGQPMCVSTYSKHQEEALAFYIYWFLDDSQWKWADGGGGVAKRSIVESERFLKAQPWNKADADTLPTMKDFWNVPVYSEMMLIEGEWVQKAYIGQVSAKEALDHIAAEHTRILKEAGLL